MSESPPSGQTSESAPRSAVPPPLPPPSQPARREETRSGYLRFLAQRVFVYFVLYALSMGPFYWHWYGSQFVGGSSMLAAFYLPLVKLAEWVPPFGTWMDWYIGFWIA